MRVPSRLLSERAVAFGYGLLVWGLVDRPKMMIVAAVLLVCGYAGIQQSPHATVEGGE